jgi:Protein of Unknown function (DUF2784)
VQALNWRTLLADAIVTIHLGIVSFVLFGLILILVGIVFRWQWIRNFWFRLAHVLTIGIVVFESLFGIECPFTTWEHDLRVAAGEAVSEASFVGRLMHWLLFYEAPEWVFTICYCIFGAIVLSTFYLAPPRLPWRAKRIAAPGAEPVPSLKLPTADQAGLQSPHFSERMTEKEEASQDRLPT